MQYVVCPIQYAANKSRGDVFPLETYMDLKQLQQKTVEIQKRFPTNFSKEEMIMDLAEELGELSQAVLIVEKIKVTNDENKRRSIEDVANALGDIMFDLLVMADKYGLDMETEYLKVMKELTGRIEQGEFDAKTE
jgi:NTP pyrophosphatase (non-canonical NTP hydrolase)